MKSGFSKLLQFVIRLLAWKNLLLPWNYTTYLYFSNICVSLNTEAKVFLISYEGMHANVIDEIVKKRTMINRSSINAYKNMFD